MARKAIRQNGKAGLLKLLNLSTSFFRLISAHSHCSHALGGPNLLSHNLLSSTPTTPPPPNGICINYVELLLGPIWHWTEAWILKNCWLQRHCDRVSQLLSTFYHRISWLQGILKGSCFTHLPSPIINIKIRHPTGRYSFHVVTRLYCHNITDRKPCHYLRHSFPLQRTRYTKIH